MGTLVVAEPLVDGGGNTGGDLGDRLRLIEQDNAVGIACCNGSVLLVDATVEVIAFAFEAILVGAVLAHVTIVSAAGARERGVERRQKKQGEIRLNVIAGSAVHGEDALCAEPAARSLVGLRRVCVAVAEDNLAALERRKNDLVKGLGAVGEHQRHLGCGCDLAQLGLALGIEQHAANAVAEPGSAGLTERDDPMSFAFKSCCKLSKLRGFTGAVEALKRDEKSARHALSLLHSLNAHLMRVKEDCRQSSLTSNRASAHGST